MGDQVLGPPNESKDIEILESFADRFKELRDQATVSAARHPAAIHSAAASPPPRSRFSFLGGGNNSGAAKTALEDSTRRPDSSQSGPAVPQAMAQGGSFVQAHSGKDDSS